jgi:hypothetical protein
MKKLIAALLGVMAGNCLAQPANSLEDGKLPPLPTPIIRRAPDLSQWTVQPGDASSLSGTGSKPGKDKAGASTVRTTIVKSGKIYWISEVDPSGRKWEKWNVDGQQVTFEPGTNQAIVRTSGSNGTTYTNFTSSDFSGMDWISGQNYIDFKEIQGRKCYLFREPVKDPLTGEITILTAAVDGETQMPVFSAVDNVVTTYRFGPPPAAPLSVPQAVRTALAQHVQGLPPLPRMFRRH